MDVVQVDELVQPGDQQAFEAYALTGYSVRLRRGHILEVRYYAEEALGRVGERFFTGCTPGHHPNVRRGAYNLERFARHGAIYNINRMF